MLRPKGLHPKILRKFRPELVVNIETAPAKRGCRPYLEIITAIVVLLLPSFATDKLARSFFEYVQADLVVVETQVLGTRRNEAKSSLDLVLTGPLITC